MEYVLHQGTPLIINRRRQISMRRRNPMKMSLGREAIDSAGDQWFLDDSLGNVRENGENQHMVASVVRHIDAELITTAVTENWRRGR